MKIIHLLVICFLIASCQVKNEYNIIGNVQGIPDSTVIDLYVNYENLGTRVASDTIMNEKFSFSDSIGDEVVNMTLRMREMLKYPGGCNLWVGKTDIKVSGTGKYLAAWKVKSNIKEQKDENHISDLVGNYYVLMDSLNTARMLNYQNNIDDKGITRSKYDSITKLKNKVELNYLKDNYNSKIAVIHLYRLTSYRDSLLNAEIKKFYPKIDTAYLNSLWGEGLRNSLNKIDPPKVGDKYVNFTALDLENKSHQLSDYIGKYILLDFWTMGCGPCIFSIPELRSISQKYQSDLVVIGVNLETKKKFWEDASKRDTITWTNLSDGKGTFGGASYIYGVNGFPSYILINPEGLIVDRWMGYWPGVFNEKLSKYFEVKAK